MNTEYTTASDIPTTDTTEDCYYYPNCDCSYKNACLDTDACIYRWGVLRHYAHDVYTYTSNGYCEAYVTDWLLRKTGILPTKGELIKLSFQGEQETIEVFG